MVEKKNKKGTWIKIIIVVILLLLIANLPTLIDNFNSDGLDTETPTFDKYIGVISILGTIGDSSEGFGSEKTYNQEFVLTSIEQAKNDKNNKGLIIYLDTPGGEVFATHEVYEALLEYKEDTKRPVYAVMGSMAASGGYYIAAACDKIYAHELTWTGSIGVTMGNVYDISGFLKKHGIKVTKLSMGRNKAMGDFNHPMTKEQKEIFMGLIEDSYNRFVKIVQKARGYTWEEAKKIADGRVYTASQAKALNLIDKYGDVNDAIRDMKLEANIKGDIEKHEFEPEEEDLWDAFSEFMMAQGKKKFVLSEFQELMGTAEKNKFQVMYLSPISR